MGQFFPGGGVGGGALRFAQQAVCLERVRRARESPTVRSATVHNGYYAKFARKPLIMLSPNRGTFAWNILRSALCTPITVYVHIHAPNSGFHRTRTAFMRMSAGPARSSVAIQNAVPALQNGRIKAAMPFQHAFKPHERAGVRRCCCTAQVLCELGMRS